MGRSFADALPGRRPKANGLAASEPSSLRRSGLTARFLRIANSPLYGSVTAIHTVNRAVTILGARLVHDIVLSASVAKNFADSGTGSLDMDAYWYRAVTRGVLARALAKEAGLKQGSHLFVDGLLAEIGHMMMYQRLPQQMEQIESAAKDTALPAFFLEQSALGFDYCHAGAFMLNEWGLPDSMVAAVQFHQTPTQAENFVSDTDIIHLAARTAEAPAGEEPSVETVSVERQGIDAETCMRLREECSEEIAESVNAFMSLDVAA